MRKSAVLGLFVFVIAILVAAPSVDSFDLNKAKDFGKKKSSRLNLKNPIEKAKRIKANLEKDVKILIGDANRLVKSKDQLIKLRNKIEKDMKAILSTINSELKQIGQTLRKTGADIETTRKHVAEIDQLIKSYR